MLIGLPIAILRFLASKVTAECAEVRRVVSSSASLYALCGLNSRSAHVVFRVKQYQIARSRDTVVGT